MRLKKLFAPLPEITPSGPFIVAVLVAPEKMPEFVQFAPTECEYEPPLNVVPLPMFILPLTVIAAPAVNETDAPPTLVTLDKFPATVKADAGKVLVAAPLLLRMRCPYVSAETVWFVP